MQSREELLGKLTDLQKKTAEARTIDVSPAPGMKYNDYRDEIEAAKPSADPAYWAKKSCKQCHGTGTSGFIKKPLGNGNTIQHAAICECVEKKWGKWQEDFVVELRKSRLAEKAPAEQLPLPIVNETNVSTTTQADPKQVQAMERIEGLYDRIMPLHARIVELEAQLLNLPQRNAVAAAQEALAECMRAEADLEALIEMKEKQAVQLEAEAEHYREMAREAIKQAANLRQQKNSEVLPEVRVATGNRQLAVTELDRTHQDLSRAVHQARKKIREVEKRKDRLDDRVDRIRKESGLNSAVFTAETDESAGDQASPTNG